MEPYYYAQMNKQQQAAYQAMKIGLTGLEDAFLVPGLEAKELAEVFFRLRLDCPEIFYAVGFKYRSYADSSNIQMLPEYLFEKGKIREHKAALKARVEKLARPAKDLPEWEKEKYIHDFICENVRYDKLKKPYSHEIIGPLGHGVGVCEGIAKSVKILCDALGIWCMIPISEANPEKKIRYRHAWNIVKIEGKFYHLDATFDNTLTREEIRYDYFNLEDRAVFRDHEPVIWKVPECADGSRFYYLVKKLSFTKQEEVERRALQAAKKKRILTFHWRGGYLTREVLKELLELIEKSARVKSQHALVSLNWPQAVLSVRFSEKPGDTDVILEEANEGEQELQER